MGRHLISVLQDLLLGALVVGVIIGTLCGINWVVTHGGIRIFQGLGLLIGCWMVGALVRLNW